MGLVGADDAVWATVRGAAAAINIADIWPTTLEMPEIMIAGTGGPFTCGEGAAKWYEAASKLSSAKQQFDQYVRSVPRDYWSGEDRDNFDKEMTDLSAQIDISHNYAMAVAVTLTGLTVPLGAWPIMCVTISVIEMAEAIAFYAAVASVVGNLGASEAIYAEGEAVSASCLSVLTASTTILTALMAAATAAIVISDVADLSAQANHGNTGAMTDFAKATIDSAPEAAISAFLAKGKREPGRHEYVPPAPRHAAAPGLGSRVLHDEPLRERLKDKAGEAANGEVIVPGLRSLVNGLIPDGDPSPDDENWGAGEPEEPTEGGH